MRPILNFTIKTKLKINVKFCLVPCLLHKRLQLLSANFKKL